MPVKGRKQRHALAEERRLRADAEEKLAQTEARLRACNGYASSPIYRPASARYDWNCECGYLNYDGRLRCNARGCGLHRQQHGATIVGQIRGLPRDTARVQEDRRRQQLVPEARAPSPVRRQPRPHDAALQTQNAQLRTVGVQPKLASPAQAATPATVDKSRLLGRSYAQVAQDNRGFQAGMPASTADTLQQQQQPQQQQAKHKQQTPAPPAADTRAPTQGTVQPLAAHATALPVGPVQRALAVESTNASGNPVLVKNIFSADEDAQLEMEDAALDEDTIQELDEDVRDPNRIFSKMGKVKKAIARRAKRLDKARHEVDLQKLVVEEAQSVLATRAQAVESIEGDLQRLRQVQEDLSRRHTELAAEAAKQQSGSDVLPRLEDTAQKAQELLWNTASSLRELGDDPRLSQAIALLGSLFQDASAAAGASSAAEASPPVHLGATSSAATSSALIPATGAVAPSAPPVVHSPLALPPAAAVQLSATMVPTSPGGAPPASAICSRCWSVACRCPPVGGLGAVGLAAVMEVDQERGKKRPCGEAELPQRNNEGHSSAGAILVDSSGNPAAPAAEEEEQIANAVEERESEGAGVGEQESKKPKPLPAPVEPDPRTDAAAVEEPTLSDSNNPEADDAGKESSRKAFSALVVATCTQRAYPY